MASEEDYSRKDIMVDAKAADQKASSVSIDLDAESADPEKADSQTDWKVLKLHYKEMAFIP